jgi:hypothetical protein
MVMAETFIPKKTGQQGIFAFVSKLQLERPQE